MLDFLNNIKFEDLPDRIKILAFVLAITIPGFGFLYITDKDFLINLSVLPFVFTTIFYSLPIYFAFAIETLLGDTKIKADFLELILESSIKTLLYFYGSCAVFLVGIYIFSIDEKLLPPLNIDESFILVFLMAGFLVLDFREYKKDIKNNIDKS